VAEWNTLMADEVACAKLSAFTVSGGYLGVSRPWLEFAKTAWGYCGMAGHARYLKTAKEIISGNHLGITLDISTDKNEEQPGGTHEQAG
jgi:hypothetical protein